MIAQTQVLLPDAKDARAFDLDSLLLQHRLVFFSSAVDSDTAMTAIKQLLWLEKADPIAPITLHINSPGGSVVDGMALYDTIRRLSCPVHGVVTGMAASMGAVILSGCTKGERAVLPHAEVMIHQPLGGAQGQATDIEIRTRHMLKTKRILLELLAANTGHTYEKIAADCDRDYWMDAEEALAYGIVDKILPAP